MPIDYPRAYDALTGVLSDMRREALYYKADTTNALKIARQVKELTELIAAVEEAASDDARRYHDEE